jgi:hypothetical protein
LARSIEVSSWDKSMQELEVSKDIADRLRSKQEKTVQQYPVMVAKGMLNKGSRSSHGD